MQKPASSYGVFKQAFNARVLKPNFSAGVVKPALSTEVLKVAFFAGLITQTFSAGGLKPAFSGGMLIPVSSHRQQCNDTHTTAGAFSFFFRSRTVFFPFRIVNGWRRTYLFFRTPSSGRSTSAKRGNFLPDSDLSV